MSGDDQGGSGTRVLPKTIVEAILGALAPERLAPERAARLRARVLEGARAPAPPAHGAGYVTIGRDQGQWVSLDPLTEVKVLSDDGRSTSLLLRLQPGARLPAHVHTADEECLCLEGELRLGEGIVLRPGDYHLAPKGIAHAVASTDGGALLFLRSDEPAYRP